MGVKLRIGARNENFDLLSESIIIKKVDLLPINSIFSKKSISSCIEFYVDHFKPSNIKKRFKIKLLNYFYCKL